MRTGPPTGPDLALLRELNARERDWFLTGRVAAAVQGVPLGWSTLDIRTGHGAYANVHAAQLASGREPHRWPPNLPAEYSPVRLDAYVAPERFAVESRLAVHVVIEGVPVRAQRLSTLLASLRASGCDMDAVSAVEAVLAQRGELPVPPAFAPEVRLGTVYGAGFAAVMSVLRGAGYQQSEGPYGGTYWTAFDDVDPRTGTQSADVSYREDPARPVTEAIRHALTTKG
jgi:hypothetical protein